MNIGFIGLGVMGRPMAANLIKGGHSLFINRVKPVSQFLVEAGAKPSRRRARRPRPPMW